MKRCILVFIIGLYGFNINLCSGQKKEDYNSKLEDLKTRISINIEREKIRTIQNMFWDLENRIAAYPENDEYVNNLSALLQFQKEEFNLNNNDKLARERLLHSLRYLNYQTEQNENVDFNGSLIDVDDFITDVEGSLNKENETLKFLSNLQFSNTLEKQLNGYRGKSEVEFNMNNNEENRQVVAGIGFDLKKGIFPGEFKMSGGLNFVQNENSLSETISNISVSYDRHLGEKSDHPLRWETYAFISRYGNSFIGLDQRWEAGAGMILNKYSSNLTEKGTKNRTKIKAAIEHIAQNQDPICDCLKENEDNDLVTNLLEHPELENSKTELERAMEVNRKKYAKFRYGILLGVLTEIENYRLKGDSITVERENLVDTSVVNNVVYESIPRFRLSLRPFIECRISDDFSLALNSYVYLPLDIEDAKVDPLNSLNKEGSDIRLDVRFSATFNVSQAVSIVISSRYHHDFRPPGTFLDVNLDGSSFLASPVQSHLMTRVKFGYKFL